MIDIESYMLGWSAGAGDTLVEPAAPLDYHLGVHDGRLAREAARLIAAAYGDFEGYHDEAVHEALRSLSTELAAIGRLNDPDERLRALHVWSKRWLNLGTGDQP